MNSVGTRSRGDWVPSETLNFEPSLSVLSVHEMFDLRGHAPGRSVDPGCLWGGSIANRHPERYRSTQFLLAARISALCFATTARRRAGADVWRDVNDSSEAGLPLAYNIF
jgi:hypothetical protein